MFRTTLAYLVGLTNWNSLSSNMLLNLLTNPFLKYSSCMLLPQLHNIIACTHALATLRPSSCHKTNSGKLITGQLHYCMQLHHGMNNQWTTSHKVTHCTGRVSANTGSHQLQCSNVAGHKALSGDMGHSWKLSFVPHARPISGCQTLPLANTTTCRWKIASYQACLGNVQG